MKKTLLITVGLLLILAGPALAAKGGNKPPDVNYQELIDAETQARIDGDAALQSQIDIMQLGAKNGVEIYADDTLVGTLIDVSIPNFGSFTDSELFGDITVLSNNGYIIKISPRLNGGWIQRNSPPIYFETNSCTGQGYTRGNLRGNVFQGYLFRSQNLEDPVTAYYGLFNEVGTIKQLSFQMYDTGCVELANPLEDTFYPVYPNDPGITGIPSPPHEVITYEK